LTPAAAYREQERHAAVVQGDGEVGAHEPAVLVGDRGSLTPRAIHRATRSNPATVECHTGETEFQFQVASFDFHSSAYEWLVISGALAQYKGTGAVNGSGNYGFLLTATDGQVSGGGGVDKFGIKSWDNDAGGAIVYDNRLGTSDDVNSANPQAIAGGSIVIHKN
jgi:hypothetical protein